ncbi:MAG: tetratricopeptide repeat protein [Thermoanaerobaculia bacterium]|nr:tetratricopeptide repeat protein [Thermoanaerobaculia bacterium]
MPSPLRALPFLRDLSLVLVLSTVGGSLAVAQVEPTNETAAAPSAEQPREVFGDEERVTLVDVLVEVPERLRLRLENGKTVEEVGLTAWTGNLPLPIVSVDAPPGRDGWTQVIYLDAPLSAEGTIPWAAQLLAARLEDLVALGPVEVILADPTPRRLLGSTANPAALDEALAGVVFDDPGGGILTDLREEVVEARETLDPEERDAFESAVAQEEIRLLTERHDLLLGELLNHPGNGRKVVYWISSGFDGAETEDAVEPTSISLRTTALAQTLAAYGWMTVPLLRPPPDAPLKPGKRIGKLRFTGFGGAKMGDPNESKGPWIPVVSLSYEEDREPERGRASYDLALALRADGRLQDAEDAFRAALRWFHGDPRTAAEQSDCWEQLAEVLHEQDRDEEARRAYEQVARLRPEIEPGSVYRSRIQEPQTALDVLAEQTLGLVVRSDSALDQVLASLRTKVVLSLQLAGTSDGALLPLEIFGPADQEILHPQWLRRGTTERIAEARGQLLLLQELEPPEDLEDLEIHIVGRSPNGLEVTLSWLPPEAVIPRAAVMSRLSLATVDETGVAGWTHHTVASATTATLVLPATPEDGLLIVVVEDLTTGQWGARIVDIPTENFTEAGERLSSPATL